MGIRCHPDTRRKLLALAGVAEPPKRSKYGNRKVTTPDGLTFDSEREYRRWLVLQSLERDGLVRDLRRQVRVPLAVNGVKVCDWTADFVYLDAASGRVEYEDVKSEPTRRNRAYRIKKKLVKAVHGIDIRET